VISYILLFVVAWGFGYLFRDMRDKVTELTAQLKKEEPDVGATYAAYGRVDPYKVNQDGDVGLVEPKTAQRLEWEEQERLRKMQIGPQ